MCAPPPRLNLVVLRSEDIERAVVFYQRLGFSFNRHAHGTGPEHYSSDVDGLVFEIYPLSPKTEPTSSARVGFQVDSVDEAVALLSQLGAKVVAAPKDSEWGRRAVVKDFDGHSVELLTSTAKVA